MEKIFKNTIKTVILVIGFSSFGQGSIKDSVSIKKVSVDDTALSITLIDNPNNSYYDRINNWDFSPTDDVSYQFSIDYLKENESPLIKKTPIIAQTKWLPIKQYQGKFYTYYPCDFYTYFKVSIDDNEFIDWTGEGPFASKIIEQNKIDNATFEFKLTGVTQKDKKLIIHIIDNEKGIAVFEEINTDMNYYYLMVASDKIKSLPLIVNNCETNKQTELLFDEPNFDELLKQSKL